MENSTPKCSLARCQEPAFGGDKKCIFHCDKTNWYKLEDGQKEWTHNSTDDIFTFWQGIEDKLEKAKPDELIDFRYFIFPKDIDNLVFSGFNLKTVNNKINFYGAIFLDIVQFQSFNFENSISLSSVVFADEVWFFDCNFEKEVESYNAIFCKDIIFLGCSFKSKFTIGNFYADKGNKPSLTFNNNDISGNFDCTLANATDKNVKSFLERSLRQMNINGGLESTGLQAIKIGRLNISDKATCRFDLSGTSMDEFKINDSNFLGLFHLANVNILKLFDLNKTIFSKYCLFDNIKLDSANKTLKEAFVSEVTFVNIEWGNKKAINTDREHFRQLKYAYDKQANYIEANEFYALEMKARQNELKAIKGHWQDKIAFWLGWLASNHSQNWIFPLLWILSLSICFYEGAVYCSGLEQSFDCYLQFANPFSTKYDGDGLGWWMTNKLFFAFLAYHFIVSLRRNTKR